MLYVCFLWQLLKEKGLLPELNLNVDDIVCALDEDLQGRAAMVANILREKGHSVELVLESKQLKWYGSFFIILVPFFKAYLNCRFSDMVYINHNVYSLLGFLNEQPE